MQSIYFGAFLDSLGHCRCVAKNAPPADPLSVSEMVDVLPPDVACAYTGIMDPSECAGHGGSHPHLVHECVGAVVHARQPAINARQSVRLMALGIIAHKSARRRGEWLKVPDWGDAPV